MSTDLPIFKKKLTPKQRTKMRIDIAKDVLKLLDDPKRGLVPRGGSYVFLQDGPMPSRSRAQLGNKLKNCQVCAMGAMLVAEVVKNDHLTVDQANRAWDVAGEEHLHDGLVVDRLSAFFDEKELRSIEYAFERHETWLNMARKYDFSTYDQDIPNNRRRLVAIMENIIRNGGTFDINDVRPPSAESAK